MKDSLIRKEDAIKALGEEPMVWTDSDFELADRNRWEMDVEALKKLPTVQPKHGKWLPDNRCGGGYWVCSSCKYPTEAFAADVLYKYCPFCGADMRGET